MSVISAAQGTWHHQFRFDHVKCLIVCRGPIRQEALEIFQELGAQPSGILLSEKDSIVYPQTLAPELRMLANREKQVHHVPDYVGATKEEKTARIAQILEICHEHSYTHLFAGYGFMAEDAEFIEAVERAGIHFVGPGSHVAMQAGAKDEAKQLARKLEVSVTPGIDNITALTLLAQNPSDGAGHLRSVIQQHGLKLGDDFEKTSLERQADLVLMAAYQKGLDLVSIAELQQETERQMATLWAKHPGKRVRFKYIGGGGGKGQRVIHTPAQVRDAVMEVLIESKATGAGTNKNFLIELNIEDTRHNEIQLLGNGEWCVALGGRDCSLQMHEQKLLEISLTPELLKASIADYQKAGETQKAEILGRDLITLEAMCEHAERFGRAVNLDSASTFECIVEGDSYYFMEVNTRIQVEHRVTEMVYSLKFVNPANPQEFFVLDSLVGAMLYLACYGKKLPKPEKLPRHLAGAEVRVNATNAALKPHAGGILRYWSPPVAKELRDDQGIGLPNPDTGMFQPYNLAGAYDSNVALVVTYGTSRLDSFLTLADILRRTEIRGSNVQLNMDFHYGLLHWLIGNDVMVKPNTRFVVSYLAMVGKLRQLSNQVNLEIAWEIYGTKVLKEAGKEAQSAWEAKETLLERPLKELLENSHKLAGWIAPRPKLRWKRDGQKIQWVMNPLEVLLDLYYYLRLEERPGVAASEKIWNHDQALLEEGLSFYEDVRAALQRPAMEWPELDALLRGSVCPVAEWTPEFWAKVQASHRGFQVGMDLLKFPVVLGHKANFFEFKSTSDLRVEIPAEFIEPTSVKKLIEELAPPPMAKSNEIVSWTGGTFYAKETPDAIPYVSEGSHFEKGDVLGILEVMKMFNPLYAEFAGTIKKIRVDGSQGVVVARGQVLFEVEPDVPPVIESAQDIHARQKKMTEELLQY